MIRRNVPTAPSLPQRAVHVAAPQPNNSHATTKRGGRKQQWGRVFQTEQGKILRVLLVGCFAIAMGIFVGLKFWSVVDLFFPFVPASLPAASLPAVQAYGQARSPEAGVISPVPFSKYYHSRDTHPVVGDRSDHYAKLRLDVDQRLPVNPARSLQRAQELRTHSYQDVPMTPSPGSSGMAAYDIYNCPDTPPTGYPFAWNVLDVLEKWPVDDPAQRTEIHSGLCVFDWSRDYAKAMTYRTAALPFLVVNDPAVARTAERWNDPGYLVRLTDGGKFTAEHSQSNHFMFFNNDPKFKHPPGWKPPIEHGVMDFKSWMERANVTDDKLAPDKEHWYFRMIAKGSVALSPGMPPAEFLYDELPFFQPKEDLLYIVEPEAAWGMNCRFGMKGVIAENHFDGSRNAITVLGGSRRYILAHPDQCLNMALYPLDHPSGRHSAVDWGNPDLEKYPMFANAQVNEVVLQAGQVLYMPTDWFHFIISLEVNYQCNVRSGLESNYYELLGQCGFGLPKATTTAV